MDPLTLSLTILFATVITLLLENSRHYNTNHSIAREGQENDYRWIFRVNGVNPDIITYLNVVKLIKGNKMDEAIKLIHNQCESSLEISKKIVLGINEECTLSKPKNKISEVQAFIFGVVFPGVAIIMVVTWTTTAM